MLFYSLMKTAKANPEKMALIFGRERLSYAQLLERVESFMDRLRLLSIHEGEYIALVLPNSSEFVVSFYAVVGLRAIVLPLNPVLKVDELKYYLADNDIRVIITDSEHAGVCREAAYEIDREFSIFIADAKDDAISANLCPVHEHLDVSHEPFEGPVICQYSSGTTDQAKKVCRTQKNLGYEIEAFVNGVHMTATDTVLCVVPLFHALGLGKCMLVAIAAGATLVILEPGMRESVASPFVFRSQRVFELIAQEQVSLLPGSPYIFGVLAETPEDVLVDMSSLRFCMTAGNLLPEETFTRFKQRFGIPLRSIYGSTETGPVALNMEPDEDVRFDSVGRPCEGVEVRITDETLHEFAIGDIGEVAVKNQSMATGYLDMPELSREKFKDGFFFMGDLGKKDEQGRLYITGRKKIFIDSGGEKVDPWEIEQALLTHPAVKEAAVVGVAGPYGGEAIKAVIVAREALTELDILLYCKSKLSDYKVPRIVEFRQELPRNILGKLVRKDLIAGQNLAGGGVQKDNLLRSWMISALITGVEAPEQLLIRRICEQVAALLHQEVAEIDVQRPLGEFGLGSLTAVELRDWLAISLELSIPVTLFWSYPTVAALATHVVSLLRQAISTPTDAPVAILASPAQEMIEAQQAFYEVEHLSDAEVQREIASMVTGMWESEAVQSTDDDLSSYLVQIERMSDAEVQQTLSQETIESRKKHL